MAVTVDSITDLRRYFRGVVQRSEHHGRSVADVVYSLLGLMLVHMDDDSDIKVWGSEGSAANILWFYVSGKRHAFRYEHADGTVEIRRENHRGPVVAKLSNTTPIAELRRVFAQLQAAPPESPTPPAPPKPPTPPKEGADIARACELCGQGDGALTVAYDSWGRDHSYHEECAIYAVETLGVRSQRIIDGHNEWVAKEEDLARWRPRIQGARETFGPTFDTLPAPK